MVHEPSTAVQETNKCVVVESGPVAYDEQEQEELDDEDDEDTNVSAAQLMGQQYGQGKILYIGKLIDLAVFSENACFHDFTK